jgi:hypothetical protein
VSEVHDPPSTEPLLRTCEEAILAPHEVAHLRLDRIPPAVQDCRVHVALEGHSSFRGDASLAGRDGPVDADARVADFGEGEELGGGVGALGEDGHRRDGDAEGFEVRGDECGEEGEIVVDEGGELVGGEASGVRVEYL